MNTVHFRRVTLAAIALGCAAVLAAPAPTAMADAAPQKITLDYQKGRCGATTLHASSFTPTTLEITTSNNFTDDAKIDMAGKVTPLPDTYKSVTTTVDLGTPIPGAIPFRVSGSDWPGSSGTGCEGWIIVA
ncbi:hypothetical protein [Nocardia sp. NPDC020380]|uniref:hypothetical protein n=1 Tax=Nocardia sp. NPDC020380 TaxID=3364309 RepID=UPI00378F2EAD